MSLMNQEGFEDKNLWELLIVDNNSNDHTREVVENFGADTSLNISYIFEKQQGKSYALNTGIANSRGQILAFTDDDVIVDKRWVASIIEASTKYSHKAFGGKVIPLWLDPIPPWIQPTGPYANPIIGAAIVSHDKGDEVKEYGEDMWVPIGANMFFRRDVLEKYGGFRTDLGPRGDILGPHEDSEMGFRLKNNGEKILYYPNAIVYHPVPHYRLSTEYLLKYFWNLGLTEARMDCPSNVMRRSKAILRWTLFLIIRFVKYCLSVLKDDPSARMYHKCQLYYLIGRIYNYATGRIGTDQYIG